MALVQTTWQVQMDDRVVIERKVVVPRLLYDMACAHIAQCGTPLNYDVYVNVAGCQPFRTNEFFAIWDKIMAVCEAPDLTEMLHLTKNEADEYLTYLRSVLPLQIAEVAGIGAVGSESDSDSDLTGELSEDDVELPDLAKLESVAVSAAVDAGVTITLTPASPDVSAITSGLSVAITNADAATAPDSADDEAEGYYFVIEPKWEVPDNATYTTANPLLIKIRAGA